MKKFAATLTLMLGMVTCGFSQENKTAVERRTPEEIAKARTEMLDKKLELNQDQKEKVYAINLEQAKNREAFRQEAKEESRERLRKRREAFKESDEKLNGVLTDGQKQKYNELKEKRKEQLKNKRGKRHDRRKK